MNQLTQAEPLPVGVSFSGNTLVVELDPEYAQPFEIRVRASDGLMRTAGGTIKILDFGLARFARQQQDQTTEESGLTSEGSALGTPDYMSPEQARDSRQADIRADIYSLGCTLYFLLAGEPPFPAGTAMQKVLAHCEQPIPDIRRLRDDVPDSLAAILNRMLATDAEDRFATPAEVLQQLKPLGTARGQQQVPQSTAGDTIQTLPQPLGKQPQPDLAALDLAALNLEIGRESTLSRGPVGLDRGGRGRINARRWLLVAVPALSVIVLAGLIWSVADRWKPAPVTREFDDGQWHELVSLVQPKRHQRTGDWSRKGGELSVSEAGGILVLPITPQRQYDLEVTFTRTSGIHSVAVIFVFGNQQATVEIDAWGGSFAGIQNIGGVPLHQRDSTAAHKYALVNGQRHTLLVNVRTNSVTVRIDNRQLCEYRPAFGALSLNSYWNIVPPQSLGVGAFESATTFHRIRYREVP